MDNLAQFMKNTIANAVKRTEEYRHAVVIVRDVLRLAEKSIPLEDIITTVALHLKIISDKDSLQREDIKRYITRLLKEGED